MKSLTLLYSVTRPDLVNTRRRRFPARFRSTPRSAADRKALIAASGPIPISSPFSVRRVKNLDRKSAIALNSAATLRKGGSCVSAGIKVELYGGRNGVDETVMERFSDIE